MARWVNLIELSFADSLREKGFNEWYDNMHLPDVLQTPGFVAARRYEIKAFRNGRGKYFTIYEIETDDIDKTMAVRLEKRNREIEQGRGSVLWAGGLVLVWNDVQYRQINKLVADKEHDPKKQRWINIVENNCVDASREKEFNEWYDDMHLSDVLQTPGFVAVTRYETKAFYDVRGKYLTIYEIETDDIDKTMAVRLEKRKEEVAQGRGNNLWSPVWRDVLWKQLTERTAVK